jgi:hypothetical protein
MDIGTLLIIAGMFLGAVIGDAVLFGKTMRVDFSLPPAVTTQGMTQEAAEQLFIAEFSRLADIAFILPFPTISQANKDSLLAVVAKPLKIDPVVEVIQSKFGSDLVSMRFAMMKGPGPNENILFGVVTHPNGSSSRYTRIGPDKRPDELVEQMARHIASEALPYRVALSDYLMGVQGDPEGFKRAHNLAHRALANGFDKSTATQRAMLYNTLGLLAVHQNDMATADALWATGMQVPMANGTAYAILAVNRAFVALGRKDAKQAREMYDIALASRTMPYLGYFDHHLDIVNSLIAWGEGDRETADEGLIQAGHNLVADTALTYRATIAAEQGRDADAKAFAEKAAFLKTLKSIHPDLVGSVFWVNPTKGGLTLRK